MKKIISILAILILTFSLVACNNNKTNENNNVNNQIENVQNENEENLPNEEANNDEPVHEEVNSGETDEDNIIDLFTIDEGFHAYSESLTIRLDETGATDLSWYLTDENDEKIVKVEDLNKQGNEHVFRFTGVSKGEKYLTFKYKKSAEDENIERVITFVFDVNENGEIALTVTGV